jgi:hypothetical protein
LGEAPGAMTGMAFLHIGLPKAGTSYVQRALDVNADSLSARGVHLAAGSHTAQRRAVWDLIGRRIEGADDKRVAGSWHALAEESERSSAPTFILSDELLVHARARQVETVSRTLRGRDLHVVVTVRDLASAIRSMWQQNTLKGRVISWPDYVNAVREPDRGPPSAGVAFWLRYDLERILGVWAAAVSAERTRIVIVPAPGSQPRELFERFADATGIDTQGLRLPDRFVHSSADAVSTELVRRLNERIRKDLSELEYLQVIRRLRLSVGRGGGSQGTACFPEEHRGWVADRSERLISFLRNAEYQILGDPVELRPRFADPAEALTVSDAELVARAVELLDMVLRAQPGPGPPAYSDDTEPRRVGARSQWRSWLRAVSFRGRRSLLEHGDRSRWIARLANTYLGRTTRARPHRPRRR